MLAPQYQVCTVPQGMVNGYVSKISIYKFIDFCFNTLSKVIVENKAYIEAVNPSGFVRVFGKAVKYI